MSEPSRKERKAETEYPVPAKPRAKTKQRPQSRQLPPYKVLLHNDDVHEMDFVVRSIMELTHLGKPDATQRMLEAHNRGVALLLTTHKERAELYAEQFASKGLTVSIEPA